MSKNRNKKREELREEQTGIDIVIPVYSNFEVLAKNIEFLRGACKDVKYRVYLVDDCSPDYETVGVNTYSELKKNFPEIKQIYCHKKNMGYGKTVNDGVMLGKSPHIFVLNSDVLMLENSIKYLYEHQVENPAASVVFPKLLFFPNSTQPNKPAGKIQHCGIAFDIEGNPFHNFIGWSPDHPFVNLVRDYNACTGAAFLITREMWKKTGGFDLAYGRGYFEDVDLMLRVRMLGGVVRYIPSSVGYHYTNASAERLNVQFPMNENRILFMKKFQQAIVMDDFILAGS